MIFADKTQILNDSFNIELPEGKYNQITIMFEGTNNAGETLAEGDLGTFLVYYQGVQKQIALAEHYNELYRLKKGAVYSASAAGGAFVIPVHIPLSLWNDNLNAWQCNRKGDIRVEWQGEASINTTKVASGNVSVYVQDSPAGLHLYCLRINEQTINDWASGLNPHVITEENLYAIYLGDDTDIEQIRIYVDKITSYNEDRWIAYMRTLLDNQIEDTTHTVTLLEFPLSRTDELSAALNDEVLLEVQAGGALAPALLTLSIDFRPEELEISTVSRQAYINTKVNRKAATRKDKDVKFIQVLKTKNIAAV